jgi:hypothetical protein
MLCANSLSFDPQADRWNDLDAQKILEARELRRVLIRISEEHELQEKAKLTNVHGSRSQLYTVAGEGVAAIAHTAKQANYWYLFCLGHVEVICVDVLR